MTNLTAKESNEAAILQQLIKNSKELALTKKDISDMKNEIEEIRKIFQEAKNWLIVIVIGTIINIFSQPVLELLQK